MGSLPGLEDVVDRQVREWTERAKGRTAAGPRALAPVVTISRQPGSRGEEIARALAAILGVRVFDKEILGYIAREANVLESVVRAADEHAGNWVEETLNTLFSAPHIARSEYIRLLSRAILAVSRHGAAVIVGRGAEFVLPRERRLAVRIVAPEAWRLANVARERGLPLDEARAQLHATEGDRRAFLLDHFHRDVDDPMNYDLVLDASRFSPEAAASIIQRAYQAL